MRDFRLIQGGQEDPTLEDKISEGMQLRSAERLYVLSLISKDLDRIDKEFPLAQSAGDFFRFA